MDETPPQAPPPQTVSPQRRLQELRAIPEKDRTDAEWDELNELEIMLASSNRAGNPESNIRRESGAPRGQQQQRRGGGQPGGQSGNQQRNRPNRGGQRQR